MPAGKPAGVRCPHLDAGDRCLIYDDPARPPCCAGLKPAPEMCGTNRGEALAYLDELERLTRP